MKNKNLLLMFFCMIALSSTVLIKSEESDAGLARFKKQLIVDVAWAKTHGIDISDHIRKIFKGEYENRHLEKYMVICKTFGKTLDEMLYFAYGCEITFQMMIDPRFTKFSEYIAQYKEDKPLDREKVKQMISCEHPDCKENFSNQKELIPHSKVSHNHKAESMVFVDGYQMMERNGKQHFIVKN